MVQVHVPQGVGVRVPPWAPNIRNPLIRQRVFSFVLSVFIQAHTTTSDLQHVAFQIRARVIISVHCSDDTFKTDPLSPRLFSSMRLVDAHECHRIPQMADESKDSLQDIPDKNPA